MHHFGIGRFAYAVGLVGWLVGSVTLLDARDPVTFLTKPNAVGRVAPNRYVTPTGQILTPAGHQIELPGMRPQALALSPDYRLLVTGGRSDALIVLDAGTGRFLQKVFPPRRKAPASTTAAGSTNTTSAATNQAQSSLAGSKTNSNLSTTNAASSASISSNSFQLSLTGLTFSPDGHRIYLAGAGGKVNVFAVGRNRYVSYLTNFALPDARAPRQRREVTCGLAVSPDGRRLYAVGNLGNRLHEFDAQTGKVLRSWDTGFAPFDVTLAAGKAYVSNLGGRRSGRNDLRAPAGRGTFVRVDPVRFIANEGSLTVVDLASGKVKTEILVGLHPSALAVSPDARYAVVANTGSDTLSVLDTRIDQLVEKIWARQSPADLFGAQPNALAFDRTGQRLYVCNGTQNAVAVIQFLPETRSSKVLGLIPVGWFPGAVEFDASRNVLCVANIKGIGANRVFKPGEAVKLISKDFYGTVSLVPVPLKLKLSALTRVALQNMRYPKLAEAAQAPRPNQTARPVPERVGEPSVFKHVIYVIKENRSYDQILGDMAGGDGNAELCTFGEKYTPNQHKIAREFVLLDNTYCSGIQSADGHQWTDSAMVNAYLERQLTSEFPRSYPSGKTEDGLDALAWASSGFLWDNALAHGKTFRNYGEWMVSQAGWRDRRRKDKIKWLDYWRDYKTGSRRTRLASKPGILSLRNYSNTNTVGWDLAVPDVMRAAEFIKELRRFEAGGGFPDFILLFLPNDHTGGTRGLSPKPGAQVADNDLAFGQIVEAVSHSKFWPETCLFAIEDDPQAGWDHVSGYRTTCYVVSPYTRRAQTVSTQYNQISLVRTIELILGLPPMNQLDATATAMADCFTATPDFTPFTSVPNSVPLDEINPVPKKVTDRTLRDDAVVSARLMLDEPDRCPEDVLNRILWRAMKGPNTPYPEWAVQKVPDGD